MFGKQQFVWGLAANGSCGGLWFFHKPFYGAFSWLTWLDYAAAKWKMRKKQLQSKLSSSAIARLGEVDIKLQLPRRTQQNFPQVSGQLSATSLLYWLHRYIKGLQGTGWNNSSNYLIHVGNNVFFFLGCTSKCHILWEVTVGLWH